MAGRWVDMAARVWSGETSRCRMRLSGLSASQVKHKKGRTAHDLYLYNVPFSVKRVLQRGHPGPEIGRAHV